jgi:EAL domain-containing protein (putative c-di-GMP-specific phosphodiesterase class I)
MLDEPEGAISNLAQLQEMGLGLHLDDFGTGYSALSCLHQLPITGLKIDRAFIHDVCRRDDRAAVLQAILQMARAFSLPVTAEGVETTEQASLLRRCDCDYVQGFLFGRPTDAANAEAFIQRQLACPALP